MEEAGLLSLLSAPHPAVLSSLILKGPGSCRLWPHGLLPIPSNTAPPRLPPPQVSPGKTSSLREPVKRRIPGPSGPPFLLGGGFSHFYWQVILLSLFHTAEGQVCPCLSAACQRPYENTALRGGFSVRPSVGLHGPARGGARCSGPGRQPGQAGLLGHWKHLGCRSAPHPPTGSAAPSLVAPCTGTQRRRPLGPRRPKLGACLGLEGWRQPQPGALLADEGPRAAPAVARAATLTSPTRQRWGGVLPPPSLVICSF